MGGEHTDKRAGRRPENQGIRHVGVIDIGKTNAKVALVDLEKQGELGVRKTANCALKTGPYPHFDVETLWAFIKKGLSELHAEYGIDALSVTTHGASLALLEESGELATPVLDYEFDGPDRLQEAYDALRPEFSETGSPRLPLGLNAGAQLFWLMQTVEGLKDRTATILTYPQYWTFRLTGERCNEVTSLGCHTDLWDPRRGDFSSLVDHLGFRSKFAPVRTAVDTGGKLSASVAQETGLPEGLPVSCGIHDSNASLLPHLLTGHEAFAVVSTGTWVIAMAMGGRDVALDETRDTLINVNAFGQPVPSARFMGGREYELVMAGRDGEPAASDLETVLDGNILLLPAIEPRSGPYQGRHGGFNLPEDSLSDGQRSVALSFYLALMTLDCLEICGATGPIVVEGPFSANPLYLKMLGAASGRPVLVNEGGVTGTSVGAALLLAPGAGQAQTSPSAEKVRPGVREIEIRPQTSESRRLQAYAQTWKQQVAAPESTLISA